MRLLSRLALVLLALPAGCVKQPLPACDSGTSRVGETASVAYAACEGKLLVVAWSDISFDDPGFGTFYQSQVNPDRAEYSVALRSAGGRAAEIKVVTTAEKAWAVAVNGQDYRTEDGAMFLVATRDGVARVTQVKHDLTGLPVSPETWARLAEENPEVKAFIARTRARE